MNKVILTGNLGADPDSRYTPDGKAVTTFDIAVSDGYGEHKKTYWFKIVAWEKLAEVCADNLKKGRKVLVEGKLMTRSYETQDGQKRKVTEIVAGHVEFLDRAQEANSGENNSNQSGDDLGINLDDLPF